MRFPSPSLRAWTALALTLAGAALFHFAGNTTGGYVQSSSLFVWVGAQWFSPLDDMGHGPLVVLAAAWLVWRAFASQRPAYSENDDLRAATAFLFAGLLLHGFGALVQMPRISFFGLLAFLAGVVEWASGREVRRRASGGILLLLLALSWSFIDTWGLSLRLRLGVTTTVHTLLSLLGLEIQRQGTLLLPPNGGAPLEVAAACAGMRSTAAMLTLAWVAGEIWGLRWWRRICMVVIALLLVWTGNVVRVLGLVALELAGGWASKGWVHTGWGVIVFVAEAALVLVVCRWLTRRQLDAGEEGRILSVQKPTEPADGLTEAQPSLRAGWLPALGVFVCMLALGGWIRSSTKAATIDMTSPHLPLTLGGSWVGVDAPLSSLERSVMPEGTTWERRIYLNPRDRREQVLVTLVWASGDRTSIHRPELCLTGMGWRVTARSSVSLDEQTRATGVALRREGGPDGAMVYWFSSDYRVEATYSGMLGQWVRDRLTLRRTAKWGYYAVQTLDFADNDGAGLLAERVAQKLWAERTNPERPIR